MAPKAQHLPRHRRTLLPVLARLRRLTAVCCRSFPRPGLRIRGLCSHRHLNCFSKCTGQFLKPGLPRVRRSKNSRCLGCEQKERLATFYDPKYLARGRIGFSLSDCSIACAIQPTIRPAAKIRNGASSGRCSRKQSAASAMSMFAAFSASSSACLITRLSVGSSFIQLNRALARGSPLG